MAEKKPKLSRDGLYWKYPDGSILFSRHFELLKRGFTYRKDEFTDFYNYPKKKTKSVLGFFARLFHRR